MGADFLFLILKRNYFCETSEVDPGKNWGHFFFTLQKILFTKIIPLKKITITKMSSFRKLKLLKLSHHKYKSSKMGLFTKLKF